MIGKFWGGGHGEVIFKDDERTLVFFRLFKALSISENVLFVFYTALQCLY